MPSARRVPALNSPDAAPDPRATRQRLDWIACTAVQPHPRLRLIEQSFLLRSRTPLRGGWRISAARDQLSGGVGGSLSSCAEVTGIASQASERSPTLSARV